MNIMVSIITLTSDPLSLSVYLLLFAHNVQANPYWAMMHTNSYKYGYSGAGNYYSYGHVYDMNDYMHRADGGRRIWDNATPVNNTESPNVVLQGGETPHANTSSTTEECKCKFTIHYHF
jgi:E3 ubiquitin-protein ligase BIG BROTHER-like protein